MCVENILTFAHSITEQTPYSDTSLFVLLVSITSLAIIISVSVSAKTNKKKSVNLS